MSRRSLSPAGLATAPGFNNELVRSLLSGAVSIDSKIATTLERTVGGSKSFWLARQAQFDASLERIAEAVPPEETKSWLKILPIGEMIKNGWIPTTRDRRSVLKSSLSYFDVTGPEEWRERYATFGNKFSFRTSPTFDSKVGSLAAWLRQGEIQAETILCKGWSRARFQAAIPEIRVLAKAKDPAYFVPRLRELCAEVGVAIVFARAPSGCRASGAARFLSPSKAMIVLSFRYLSDDHFWFTVFHEAGHLLLHGDEATFVDGEVADRSDKENEANAFAAAVLVPPDRIATLMALRPQAYEIIKFAVSIGVSPGIVVGQMQHAGIVGRHQLNRLKRRYTWDQVIDATC